MAYNPTATVENLMEQMTDRVGLRGRQRSGKRRVRTGEALKRLGGDQLVIAIHRVPNHDVNQLHWLPGPLPRAPGPNQGAQDWPGSARRLTTRSYVVCGHPRVCHLADRSGIYLRVDSDIQ